MKACVYCGRDGAALQVGATSFAHRPCFERADDEDERLTLMYARLPVFAPDELVALEQLHQAERLPPIPAPPARRRCSKEIAA